MLQPITASDAERIGEERTRGVRVTHIDAGGLAARAGIRAGDVIVAVGGQFVTTIEEFHAAIRQHDLNSGVRVQVTSEGVRRFVFLKKDLQAPAR